VKQKKEEEGKKKSCYREEAKWAEE